MTPNEARERFLEQARLRPGYVGYALARYQAEQGLTRAELVSELACDAATLDRLALCWRPRRPDPQFEAQVDHLVATFRVDESALLTVLNAAAAADEREARQAEAGNEPGAAGMRAAARRREGDAAGDGNRAAPDDGA